MSGAMGGAEEAVGVAADASDDERRAGRLAAAVAALGVAARVEPLGRLAVLHVAGDVAPLADPALRERLMALATDHGFTHVALELSAPADSLTSRAGAAGDSDARLRRA